MCSVPEHNDIELRVARSDGSNDHLLAPCELARLHVPCGLVSGRKAILASGLQITKEIRWVLDAINVADGAVKELISGSAGVGGLHGRPTVSCLISIELEPENRSQLWMVPSCRRTNPLFQRSLGLRPVAGNDSGRKGDRRVGAQRECAYLDRAGRKTAEAEQVATGETPDGGIAPGPAGKLLVRSRGSDLALMNADGSQRALLRPNLSTTCPCRLAPIATWYSIRLRKINYVSCELTRTAPTPYK